MANFYEVIYYLQAYGIYDYLLPLLLFFTIIFAALEKTMVLGHYGKDEHKRPKSNLNIVVALIIALIVIVNVPATQFVSGFLSNTGVIIIIAIVFLLFIALFSPGVEFFKEGTMKWIGLALAILAVLWALRAYNIADDLYYFNFITSEAISWLIAVGMIIGVIILLKSDSRGDKPKEKRTEERY